MHTVLNNGWFYPWQKSGLLITHANIIQQSDPQTVASARKVLRSPSGQQPDSPAGPKPHNESRRVAQEQSAQYSWQRTVTPTSRTSRFEPGTSGRNSAPQTPQGRATSPHHPEELRDCATGGRHRQWCQSSHGAGACLLYTSPSPRDQRGSRMPSSA